MATPAPTSAAAAPGSPPRDSWLSKLPQGWALTLWIAALLALGCAALYALMPGVDGVRLVIRTTARSSLALFCLAFTAAALWQLWPSMHTQWLRRNRRYLGVAFAASHALHLGAIALFARMDPAAFDIASEPRTRIFGAVAYGFIALMTLTSFDKTAALLGRRAWGWLHTVGAHYIWLIFLISNLKRTPLSAQYWIGVVIVVAMLALRLYARYRARRAANDTAGASMAR